MTTNGEDQPKPPLFQRIKAQNVLSFGPDGVDLELGPLNVLIGPNGSGKSNLLDVISLFQAAPRNLSTPVRDRGGIQDWIWRGDPGATAILDAVVHNDAGQQPLRHRLEFAAANQFFDLVDERVENEHPYVGQDKTYFFYRFQRGNPVIQVRDSDSQRRLERDQVASDESILSQRNDPDSYPVLAYLSRVYRQMRLYRDWHFGRNNVFRQPQRSDVARGALSEDFSNLGVFLNRSRQFPSTKARLVKGLSDLYDGLSDFELNFDFGTVQVFFQESDFAIPASRLSDGSLRYLCLLSILLDPEPPPLIAIDEPEMGLHPDLIHKIADLLVDASNRTQLVVTTHSEILVDALHDRPEAIVVCEKHEGQTTMERLDASKLAVWLEKYRLGDLWTSGQLGGVRW